MMSKYLYFNRDRELFQNLFPPKNAGPKHLNKGVFFQEIQQKIFEN